MLYDSMVLPKSPLNTMKLITISANNDFIEILVKKFYALYGNELNEAIFFMPNNLSADKLKEVFASINITPKIFSLGNLDCNSIRVVAGYLKDEVGLLPEKYIMSNIHRLIGVVNIVQNYLDMSFKDIQFLCMRILDIYDLMQKEGVGIKKIKKKLSNLQEYDNSNIITLWSSIVQYIDKNPNVLDVISYRNFIIENLSNIIARSKSNVPIIIAGSTGSNYDIAMLMNSILHFQKGYVVFSGYEVNNIDVDEIHPQYIMRQWVKKYAKDLKIDIWGDNSNILSSLFSTDNIKPIKKAGHIFTLECNYLHEEAQKIVDIVLQNREESVCVVVTDDFLKQRILSLLSRHHIEVNYMCSTSLMHTSLGQIIYSTLEYISNPSDVDNISYFKDNSELFEEFIKLTKDYLPIGKWCILHKQLVMKIINQSWDFTILSNKKVSFIEYCSIIKHYLVSEVTDEYVNNNSNISILEPIHARLLDFDLTIVSSMNEGCWPKSLISDGFMRHTVGLFGSPKISRSQSLAAHDIFMLLNKKKVVLTRSKYDLAGTSIPSRWWQKLTFQNLANTLPLLSLKNNNGQLLPNILPACSGVKDTSAVVPNKISVTQVEKLIADPYSLYVSHILGLRPTALSNEINLPARFGTMVHKLLEKLTVSQGNYDQVVAEVLLENLSNLEQKYPDSFWYINIWRRKLLDLRTIVEFFNEIIAEPGWQRTYAEKYVNWALEDFTIYGYVDRIDLYDDKIVITDFKTGILPTKSMIESGKSIQLPLLARLIQEDSELRRANIYLRYIKIKKDNVIEIKELEDTENYMMLAEQYARLVVKYLKNSDSAFAANNLYDSTYFSRINSIRHLERYVV